MRRGKRILVDANDLAMRMSKLQSTRLTDAFSKRIENHSTALALYFVFYSFFRIHRSLRTSPAMATGSGSDECGPPNSISAADLAAIF
jgi:hypothetical protein